jgi:uncharacterized protein YcbK (DUF882 family)
MRELESKYFTRQEFACQCGCGFDGVDAELIQVLDRVREHYGSPVTITSGCRCKARNKAVGGVEKSRHLPNKSGNTEAADFKVREVSHMDVEALLNEWFPNSKGIGSYPNRTHFDIRDDKARWTRNV